MLVDRYPSRHTLTETIIMVPGPRGHSDFAVLPGGADSSGYSFDAFSQHLSVEQSGGETSSSSATMSNSPQQAIVPRGPLPIAHLDALTRAPARKKNERRGHFKSRNGCFNCKKRRIKVITDLFSPLVTSPR